MMGVDHYLEHLGLGQDPEERYYGVITCRRSSTTRVRSGDTADGGSFVASLVFRNHDARMAGDVLRAYFRKLKPALVLELMRRQAIAS